MSRKRRGRDEDNGFAEWGGYMEAKKAKLLEQYEGTLDKVEKLSDIFNGVAIFVNGLTHPNGPELKLLMAAHGGTYHLYQSSKTTHIIASNLPNVKINKLGSVPIVKPSWVTDSIELGKLLDYRRYLLYTNQSSTQPRLNFPVMEAAAPTKTASDPSFLQEFYNNSRLHLISTLGAEFKQLIGQLRESSDGHFPGLDRIRSIAPQKGAAPDVVMHIDMDCFFVSVGLRNRPDLMGKPVAVTHARSAQIQPNRNREIEIKMNTERLEQRNELIDGTSSLSEIASCSYEARKCGVKNGMFLGTAIKLCPELQTIPYDFEGYKQVSHTLYKTIASYTLDIEAVSCDEMYVDVGKVLALSGMSVDEWARHIRSEMTEATGCPCSAGFGANRLQARLATKRAKPNGQFHLRREEVEEYMAGVALGDLPGVGHVTLKKLKNLGMSTCGDLQVASLRVLQQELGPKQAETLLEQARGIDRRPLNFHHERKSVSAEVNYGIRFKTTEECRDFLESLSVEVCSRLAEVKMRARCLTLKVMVRAMDAPVETAKFLGHGICDSLSKSVTTNGPVSEAGAVFREVRALYDKLNLNFADLRGLGIQLSKLEKMPPLNTALSKFLQTKEETASKFVEREKQEPKVELDAVEKAKPDGVSSTKSGRGRPKGSKNSKKIVARPQAAPPINEFFKAKKELSQEKVSKKNINLEVLKELPKEIQDEIISEYDLEADASGAGAIERDVVRTKSPFAGLGWHGLRPVLGEWMRAEPEPSRCDVDMLAEHLRTLAVDRRIEDLLVIFNFLHRNFSGMGCKWHEAYHVIADVMQRGMIARYGTLLAVKKNFGACCAIL